MRALTIDGKRIDDTEDCYVIAEIGHNHQGSVEQCKKMFRIAKECGAHAVKLQKRNNKAIFTEAAYNQVYDNRNSYGDTYGVHREVLEFDEAQFRDLIQYAADLGITLFSTAFDVESADMLDKLGTPAYKVASFDLRFTPLLRHVAEKGKPIIISTGASTLDDIRRAYEVIHPINPNVAILQCTSSYPCEFEELDLGVITTLRHEFEDCVIGYSGHDSGIAMAVAAYVLGARIVEKHFTLNRASKGTDHAFSLEPVGLRKMCRDLQRCRAAMGDGVKKVYESEKRPFSKMSKKIVAAGPMSAGTVLDWKHLDYRSPGDGMPPWQADQLVGRTLKCDVGKEETLSLDLVN